MFFSALTLGATDNVTYVYFISSNYDFAITVTSPLPVLWIWTSLALYPPSFPQTAPLVDLCRWNEIGYWVTATPNLIPGNIAVLSYLLLKHFHVMYYLSVLLYSRDVFPQNALGSFYFHMTQLSMFYNFTHIFYFYSLFTWFTWH